jgi:hypothetical protein
LTLCFPIGFHFLAYPNLFGIKGFVVVVVVVVVAQRVNNKNFVTGHLKWGYNAIDMAILTAENTPFSFKFNQSRTAGGRPKEPQSSLRIKQGTCPPNPNRT